MYYPFIHHDKRWSRHDPQVQILHWPNYRRESTMAWTLDPHENLTERISAGFSVLGKGIWVCSLTVSISLLLRSSQKLIWCTKQKIEFAKSQTQLRRLYAHRFLGAQVDLWGWFIAEREIEGTRVREKDRGREGAEDWILKCLGQIDANPMSVIIDDIICLTQERIDASIYVNADGPRDTASCKIDHIALHAMWSPVSC